MLNTTIKIGSSRGRGGGAHPNHYQKDASPVEVIKGLRVTVTDNANHTHAKF